MNWERRNVRADFAAMLSREKENGFPDSHWPQFEAQIWEHTDNVSTRFSSTDARSLVSVLGYAGDACPTGVRLRN